MVSGIADVKWIKITTGLFDNRKIRQIESLPEGDRIIVIWVKMLCLAGNINDNGLMYITREVPYTEEMLAQQFNRPLHLVKLALDTFVKFSMIEIIDDVFHISNWEKYQNVDGLDKIREQTRARVAKHRENKKNVDCNVTVTQCNATDIDIEEEKENNNTMCNADADALFERLWKIYPHKRGKGQVSSAKKRHLLDIGFEELERAVNRYKADLAENSWRKPQNGSTFFNSGYVDYLDEEWYKTHPQEQAAEQVQKAEPPDMEVEENEDDVDWDNLTDDEWTEQMERLAAAGKILLQKER